MYLPIMNFVAGNDLNVEKLSSFGPVQQEKAQDGGYWKQERLCAQLPLHHSSDSVALLSK